MTLIHDAEIDLLARTRDLIEPYDVSLVQPASIDVRLDRHLRVMRGDDALRGARALDPEEMNMHAFDFYDMGTNGTFIVEPGDLVLGSTVEKITLPAHIAARFEGKSSLGRLGLMTHVTAGFIDPGFSGTITVEIATASAMPIRLHAGMLIGQICFYRMAHSSVSPYGSEVRGSHYQSQSEPTMSRSWKNFRKGL